MFVPDLVELPLRSEDLAKDEVPQHRLGPTRWRERAEAIGRVDPLRHRGHRLR